MESLAFLVVLTLPKLVALPPGDDVSLVPLPFRIYNWLLVIFGVGYTTVTLHLLNNYFRAAKEVTSSLESVRLEWLRYLTLAAMSAWIIFLVENTLMTFGINLSDFLITSICAGIYVYSIGYFGLLKSEVFSTRNMIHTDIAAKVRYLSHSSCTLSREDVTSFAAWE